MGALGRIVNLGNNFLDFSLVANVNFFYNSIKYEIIQSELFYFLLNFQKSYNKVSQHIEQNSYGNWDLRDT